MLIVAGGVIGLAVLFPILRHYQLRFAVAKYIAELKAKGEPMDLAQVTPPSVPPDQNSAADYQKAVSMLTTNWNVLGSNPPPAMRMVVPGKAMIGWNQPLIRDALITNTWEEAESALSAEKDALALLCLLPDHPTFDFKIDFSMGPEKIQLLHLATSKKAAQRLAISTLCSLRRGDTASAGKNIQAILSLVNGLSHDRVVISELVRIALAQIALNVNWEYLQSTNVTDEQLAVLQRDWTSLEFIHAEERALELDRADDPITLADWRNSNAALRSYFDMWENLGLQGLDGASDHRITILENLSLNAKIYLWRFWWSYPDELRTLKVYNVLLDTVRKAETNCPMLAALHLQEAQLQKLSITTNSENLFWFGNPEKMDMHNILSSSATSLANVFNKEMKVETARQLIIAAIALKRFHLKQGSYPENLTELMPDFLPAVPFDPIDDQPLRYRRHVDGTFLLYSIGNDGVDDGGNPKPSGDSQSLQWQRGRDWVWPQPATPEEVQYYYAHPPK